MAIPLSFTGYAISVYYRKTNEQKMIIIEEGWEHAIKVYISFLTTDTSFKDRTVLRFLLNMILPSLFKKKNPNWIFSVQ